MAARTASRPRESSEHRARAAAQRAGDRRIGEVVDVAQGQGRALARGQAVEEREAPREVVVARRR
jgi:hypothetical protein